MERKIFKIKKFMKYSLKEYAVYATIAAHSGGDNICKLTRRAISDLSGVSDLDTISKYTSKFEKDGLLKKINHIDAKGRKLVDYKLLEQPTDYLLITYALFGGDPKMLGFVCLLAQYKYKNTNIIQLSTADLYRKMGMSKTAFYRYIKEAEKMGYVEKIENGYKMSEKLFPEVKNTEKEKIDQTINEILDMEDGSRAKNILLTYYDPQVRLFSEKIRNVKDFLDYCLSGVPKKNKEKPKEFEKIDIKF